LVAFPDGESILGAARERTRQILNGLNAHAGRVTHQAVADALGCDMVEPETVLAA
jgi:alanine dehydrogenase